MKVGLIYASVSSHIETPSRCFLFPLVLSHELLMSLRCSYYDVDASVLLEDNE